MYKEGNILLVHNTKVDSAATLFGWLIQKTLKTKWNHVAMVVEEKGTLMVYESVKGGCMITGTLENWLKKSNTGYRVFHKIDAHLPSDWEQRYIKTMGKPYDYEGAFWFYVLYLLLNKWLGRTKGHNGSKYWCSELIGYIFDLPEYWKMTPKDLAIYFDVEV